MEKMLAAVFEDVGKLELKMVPVPQIQREDQVLVEVEAVSICTPNFLHSAHAIEALEAGKDVLC